MKHDRSLQIAEHNFLHPTFIRAHVIVFSEDVFAVIFADLHSISMFCRVKENLGAKQVRTMRMTFFV